MANMYRPLDCTSTQTIITSFKNALIDKYGSSGVIIHYENQNYFIFSCPSINEKIIKLYTSGVSSVNLYYGNSYTSGSSIANESQFFYTISTGQQIHVVFGDSFMLMNIESNSNNGHVSLIAKTKSGKSICYGAIGTSNSGYVANVSTMNVSENRGIKILSFANNLYSSANVPYVIPVILFYSDTNIPLKQSDGSFDTIDGLNMSCYTGKFLVRENAMFTTSPQYSNGSTAPLTTTALMAEF